MRRHKSRASARSAIRGLGERVKQRREQLGWNQTELAYRAGMTQAKVSQVENARARGGLYAASLMDLAKALDVSADWLLGLSSVQGSPRTRQG